MQYYQEYKHYLLAVLMAAILLPLHSCSLIKQAETNHANKKLTKIWNRYPEVVTSNFAKWFPATNSIGTIDTNKNDLDSISHYKHIADSLSGNKPKPTLIIVRDTFNHITDTCETIEECDIDTTYYKNEGYANGRASCPVSTTLHDSVLTSAQQVLIANTLNDNKNLITENTKLNQQVKDKNTYLWIFGGISILLLLFCGYLIGKVFQKQTTNTITKL